MMRVYQMRDPSEIEAFVLARDYDHAFAMFERYLKAHGGDPDCLLYREWKPDRLEGDEHAAVNEALEIQRAGLLTCDTMGAWVFIVPLGDRDDTG